MNEESMPQTGATLTAVHEQYGIEDTRPEWMR